jgi:hypothetical protein
LKKVQKTAKRTVENRKNPFKEKKSENKTVKQNTKPYRKEYWTRTDGPRPIPLRSRAEQTKARPRAEHRKRRPGWSIGITSIPIWCFTCPLPTILGQPTITFGSGLFSSFRNFLEGFGFLFGCSVALRLPVFFFLVF